MNNNRKMNFRPSPASPWKYTKTPKKKNAGGILFTVAIVFFSITLIGLIIVGLGEYHDHLTWYNYHEDEESLLRSYTYGNYSRLLEAAFDDANIDRKYTDTELELHAVAEYYEAATLVRAFEAAGDEERAELYRKRMKEITEKMGEFSKSTEEIDKIIFEK